MFRYKFEYFQVNIFSLQVDTTWTQWDGWSACDQMCDTGSQYRNRQCPGSNPRGQINKPAKTAQYGGERDCANSGNTGAKQEQNCNTFDCNRKEICQMLIICILVEE